MTQSHLPTYLLEPPGFPAEAPKVTKDDRRYSVAAEFEHLRIWYADRRAAKKEARKKWLQQPGAREKKRACQRAYKKNIRTRARVASAIPAPVTSTARKHS